MFMNKILVFILSLFLISSQESWVSRLEKQVAQIDKNLNGEIGLYLKVISDNRVFSYNEKRNWYFASTVKIPIAIAVMQKVESGEISLSDELTLQESDFVDGSGDLLDQKPGTKYTVADLLDRMIRHSDSTAADMLMRLVGEDEINEQIKKRMVLKGINRITPIMQVRYDAYSEIHKNAQNLTNMDIVQINSKSPLSVRMTELLSKLNVDRSEIKAKSIEDAFERYYKRELNSGKLESMGIMLERLHNGELLNKQNSEYLIKIMETITTGDRRIKAGLPEGTRYAQKTGTQVRRICNIGIIYPKGSERMPIIVVACVKEFSDFSEAEKALENIGKAISNILMQ
jgi:beta-lactamase class A